MPRTACHNRRDARQPQGRFHVFRRRRGTPLPGVPMVTILTDLADYPPHFWIEQQPQHFICGSDKAVEQAFAMGHTKERVHRVSGMILNPRFYEMEPLSPEARAAARKEL